MTNSHKRHKSSQDSSSIFCSSRDHRSSASHIQSNADQGESHELPPLALFAHEPFPVTSGYALSLFRSNSIAGPLSSRPISSVLSARSASVSAKRDHGFLSSNNALLTRHGPIHLPRAASSLGNDIYAHDSLFKHTQNRNLTTQSSFPLQTSLSQPIYPISNVHKKPMFQSPQNLTPSASQPFSTSLTPSSRKNTQATQSSFVHRNQISISSHMDLFSLNSSLDGKLDSTLLPSAQQAMTLLPQKLKLRPSDASLIPPGPVEIQSHQQTQPNPGTQVGVSTLSPSHENLLHNILGEMLKVDAFNLNSFLLSLLHKVNPSLPLDDFYNILYNPKTFNNFNLHTGMEKIDKTVPSDDITDSIEIIQRVLEVFRSPESLYNQFPALEGTELKPSNVNLHELLRSFLAIKILRHSLIEDDGGNTTPERSPIPRLDIYKVYYILCQKLILKYPSSSNTTSLQQKLIFGQSKLGKLIKLVYPNLVSKRLGRRGESRYNYLGIRWNENIVSDEITQMFNSDLPQLTELFKVLKKPHGLSHGKLASRRQSSLGRFSGKKLSSALTQPEMIFRIKAQGTFVEPNHFYPEGAFTLKAFLDEQLNDNIEKNWFAATLKTSTDALATAGVLPDDINRLLFSADGNSEAGDGDDDELLRGIVDFIIPKLLVSPDQPKIYLHLFMVISLKVFPHLLLLRKPLHSDSIKSLTGKVTHLIKKIESEMGPLVNQKMEQQDIRNFLGILSRMIHLNQLLAAFFKADLQDYVLKEMQEDVTRIVTEGEKDGLNETYRLISEACISVLLACRYKPLFRGVPVTDSVRQFLFESCHSIEQMVSQDLALFVMNVMEGWLPQTEESFHGALKFRLLLATLKLVDEGVLNEDIKARFPALVIRGLYSRIAIQILQFTYRAHASMLGGKTMTPANPTFRLWYVLESFIQEYLDVLAEINSLHLKAVEQP